MKIIINQKNLSPIFENIIIKQAENKDNIISKNTKQITLISDNNPVIPKDRINTRISNIKLYDKNLYLFLTF